MPGWNSQRESKVFYEFDLEAELKEFAELSDQEQYEILEELQFIRFHRLCGKNNAHCETDTFTLKSGGDTFVVHPHHGFRVTKNDEKLDPDEPSEEEKKIAEMYSSFEWMAESLYYLKINGYPFSYTFKHKKKDKPDLTYTMDGVKESAHTIQRLLEEIGADDSLIQNAKQMQEKMDRFDPLKGYEYNDQVVKSFIPEIESIVSVYFPSALERPVFSGIGNNDFNDYFHKIK